ncbi:uncharacterized protein [Cicer arietinum]|uniref:Phosphatidylinositol transfer protein 3-like isoform X1 n=1 Tax=Cicer arietinum TaxID=3827 RepID=A0A1S2YFS7_CICAR|nr:phosphatidylinositol transfer protein 3-like isoform X2 [Cicer arietinum]XP_027192045.1 phosphatidylinositol transfer protein 3-like isoform X1 [Cicer arietinum]
MEEVKVNGCDGGSSLEDSNKDLAYVTKGLEAKAQVIVNDVIINETELTKIRLLRAFVETQDPSSKDYSEGVHNRGRFCIARIEEFEEDDLTIRRFLRARDLDVEKASTMFLKYLKWRRSFVPNGSITLPEISNDLADNKVYVQGHNKIGQPIILIFGAKHFQRKNGLDEFKRFVVYALDKICVSMPRGQEKFVSLVELKGWGYSNSDVRGYINALSILQDYYPERLGKLLILHAPYIFMRVWKIVNPFIDNKTREKIVFVESNKLKSTLLEEIDETQLPEIFGGKQQLVPIQDI